MEHIAFPSIEQFRTVIKEVQTRAKWAGRDENGKPILDNAKLAPKLKFQGTVKLHGTNASVVQKPDGTIYFQSRNNIITPENDNLGFAKWASKIDWINLFTFLPSGTRVIYGEWCGSGIQKGIAISALEKMFVIFKIKVDDEWLDMRKWGNINNPQERIFNIQNFQTWEVEIDFENPQAVQNDLITITKEVEAECPVGKAFGISGIGEGVVWSCVEPEYSDSRFVFKVKGEKHSVTKVKTLAAVDVEKMNSIKEFVDATVTENRCKQGIAWLHENGMTADPKNTGDFIRWVYNDIIKEESDTIKESGLEEKAIGGFVAKAAKTWFFQNLE